MKSFRGYVTENGMHNGKNGGGMGAQDHAEKKTAGVWAKLSGKKTRTKRATT